MLAARIASSQTLEGTGERPEITVTEALTDLG
jgi:hypothetical protein